jgi:murein L,D-transpeptidase YafK
LGRGGVGKTREGDGKTPIGVYPLGEPRQTIELH